MFVRIFVVQQARSLGAGDFRLFFLYFYEHLEIRTIIKSTIAAPTIFVIIFDPQPTCLPALSLSGFASLWHFLLQYPYSVPLKTLSS